MSINSSNKVTEVPVSETATQHTLSISLDLDSTEPMSRSDYIQFEIASRLALDYFLEKLKKLQMEHHVVENR